MSQCIHSDSVLMPSPGRLPVAFSSQHKPLKRLNMLRPITHRDLAFAALTRYNNPEEITGQLGAKYETATHRQRRCAAPGSMTGGTGEQTWPSDGTVASTAGCWASWSETCGRGAAARKPCWICGSSPVLLPSGWGAVRISACA